MTTPQDSVPTDDTPPIRHLLRRITSASNTDSFRNPVPQHIVVRLNTVISAEHVRYLNVIVTPIDDSPGNPGVHLVAVTQDLIAVADFTGNRDASTTGEPSSSSTGTVIVRALRSATGLELAGPDDHWWVNDWGNTGTALDGITVTFADGLRIPLRPTKNSDELAAAVAAVTAAITTG